MKSKALVLLSGGLDSSVNLFEAAQKHEVVLALSFNYGQKAAAAELRSAKLLAEHIGVPHKVVDLSFFKDFNKSSLLVRDQKIPTGAEVQISDKAASQKTATSVWVPNRNGIFLNIAAGFAEALDAQFVIPGFNAEEAQTFPDNSEAYMGAVTEALTFSTANKVSVQCYTTAMFKADIVKKGLALGLPFEKIWPCYFAGESWCGECESCQRSKSAMQKAGLAIDKLFKVK